MSRRTYINVFPIFDNGREIVAQCRRQALHCEIQLVLEDVEVLIAKKIEFTTSRQEIEACLCKQKSIFSN